MTGRLHCLQILSVDEMGEGIKPIRPQSLVDMMRVSTPCLFLLNTSKQLLLLESLFRHTMLPDQPRTLCMLPCCWCFLSLLLLESSFSVAVALSSQLWTVCTPSWAHVASACVAGLTCLRWPMCRLQLA